MSRPRKRDYDQPPLKLAFEPGEYLCTWRIPLGDGEFSDFSGSLTVQPGRMPTGTVYGVLPIKWNYGPRGQKSAGFPQEVETEVLTAQLSTGANAILTDVRITYWSHGRGHISAAAAILTLDSPSAEAEPRYCRIEFQIEGLDAVAGVAPLKRVRWPFSDDLRYLEGTWSAEGNPDSSQEWSDDQVVMQLGYSLTARVLDAYAFRMRFSPVIRIEVQSGLTIREWIDQWVQPIHRVVSIAIGESTALTYLATYTPSGDQSTRRGQVFGIGITQQPYESSLERVRDMNSALMLKSDDASLLAITRKWQRLEADRHPLIETYGSMLSSHDQHPRSRFLLLIQAIEGLHGYETRKEFEERCQRHEEQRAKLLDTAAAHLSPDDMKFLNRNLRRDPPTGLEDALRTMILALPVDLTAKLGATALIRSTKDDEPRSRSTFGALRVIRNNLAHGLRGYDPHDLHLVVQVLERVVRAHALRVLGCPPQVLERALRDEA